MLPDNVPADPLIIQYCGGNKIMFFHLAGSLLCNIYNSVVVLSALVHTFHVYKYVSFAGSCPGNCSIHGICHPNGICECQIGWTGVDCSTGTVPHSV